MKEERLEEENERVKRVLPVAPAIEEGAVTVIVLLWQRVTLFSSFRFRLDGAFRI